MCCHGPGVPALCSDLSLAGQKRAPRRGEQQGWNDSRGTEVTLDRAERRSYREYRPYETERQADFTPEKFTDEKYVLQTSAGRAGGARRFKRTASLCDLFMVPVLGLFCQLKLAVTLSDT